MDTTQENNWITCSLTLYTGTVKVGTARSSYNGGYPQETTGWQTSSTEPV